MHYVYYSTNQACTMNHVITNCGYACHSSILMAVNTSDVVKNNLFILENILLDNVV